MYTSTDLAFIHDPYFTVLQLSEDCCELQSNNTKHCWYITKSQDSIYILFHKHHAKNPYHYHSASPYFQDCLLEIADHDEYQLRGRKPARAPSKDTFFDSIIRGYQGI